MPYITRADLEERYGADMIALVAADDAAVTRAIADAGALADSHLAGRGLLPLSEPFPAALVWAVARIARHLLSGLNRQESVEKDHAEAMAWLKSVADGRATLPASVNGAGDGGASSPAGASAPAASFDPPGGGRLFSRATRLP